MKILKKVCVKMKYKNQKSKMINEKEKWKRKMKTINEKKIENEK